MNSLLVRLGQAFLAHTNGNLNTLAGVLPEIADDVFRSYAQSDTGSLRAELERLLRASSADYNTAVSQAVQNQTGSTSPESLRAVAEFLKQVPAAARRACRNPSDPTGRTGPSCLVVRADDLLRLLPVHLPRFAPGQQPLTGTDLELVELLGIGGFGEVWKARHQDRPESPFVALKFCTGPGSAKALEREKALLDRVEREGRHPGIIKLLYTHLRADPPCLEYEYVAGGDLSAYLPLAKQQGQTTPAWVARQVAKLARIVGFAHGIGIVHRDLKPANVLVATENGEPVYRIADFGIGAVSAGQALASYTRQRTSMSEMRGQSVRGSCTPLYASPQQLRGDPADPRDDVHALGVIWYQMLTGDLLRGRPSGGAWKRRLADQGMPAELVQVLESCSEEEPDDRPANGNELADRIERPMGSAPKVAVPESRPATPADPGLEPPRDRSTVVVAATGPANFRSIGEAVKAVTAGGTVRVKPGVYRESVTLDKAMTLQGDGNRDEIVVEATLASCVRMATDRATVKGLSLRCLGKHEAKEGEVALVFHAAEVMKGHLQIEDCDITAEHTDGIGVLDARAAVKGCRIRDCGLNGIVVGKNGQATVRDSQVVCNKANGIFVQEGGKLEVYGCELEGNDKNGSDSGMGDARFEKCRIWRNKEFGLASSSRLSVTNCSIEANSIGITAHGESDLNLVHSQVFGNRGDGLEVKSGRFLLEESEFNDNGHYGISIQNGNGTIQGCKIHDSSDFKGISLQLSRVTMSNCEIYNNGSTGCDLYSCPEVRLHSCRIHDNHMNGLDSNRVESLEIVQCEINSNASQGMYITRSQGCVRNTSLCKNGKNGAHVSGEITVEECTIRDNERDGLELYKGKDTNGPTVRRCMINYNGKHAIYALGDSRTTVIDCDLSGNAEGAWHRNPDLCDVRHGGNRE